MRFALSLLCAVTLAACAAPGIDATRSPTPERGSMEPREPSSRPTFDLVSRQPSRAPAGDGTTISGLLGADAIEGGCGYLQAPNGTRYQVIYPDGWDLQLNPLQLTSPEGEIVARGGDEVTVRGDETSEMASICQIGPMFRAIEVVLP
jgi:hypothetical protein